MRATGYDVGPLPTEHQFLHHFGLDVEVMARLYVWTLVSPIIFTTASEVRRRSDWGT